jgi:hypothetical protein
MIALEHQTRCTYIRRHTSNQRRVELSREMHGAAQSRAEMGRDWQRRAELTTLRRVVCSHTARHFLPCFESLPPQDNLVECHPSACDSASFIVSCRGWQMNHKRCGVHRDGIALAH